VPSLPEVHFLLVKVPLRRRVGGTLLELGREWGKLLECPFLGRYFPHPPLSFSYAAFNNAVGARGPYYLVNVVKGLTLVME
jgi:hypothetical protein